MLVILITDKVESLHGLLLKSESDEPAGFFGARIGCRDKKPLLSSRMG